MSNKEYWKKRSELLENAQHRRGASYFATLEEQYSKACLEVQKDVEKWYSRFADNNEISLTEARKLLNLQELKEFKWSVEDYIEKGQKSAITGEWEKQLENASARWHISRLDALKLQMQNHVEVLYGNEHDDFAKTMEKIYTEGYYRTAFDVQQGIGIGSNLMRLDPNEIEKVISKPWAADGANFSDRIWKQKNQLVSELHNGLTQAIIRGKNPGELADEIAKKFNVSKGQAGRLVMTESSYFASVAAKDAYKDLDVEKYEILATLDGHTSDICQDMDGQVFKMSEYEPGVTAPPFHCWCRSTTVPYFDDEFDIGERAARSSDGKVYYVPEDMTYKEWKESFVNSEKSDIIKNITLDDFEIMARGKNIDEEALNVIYSTIHSYEEKGEIYISSIYIGSLGVNSDGIPLLQIEPLANGLNRLNINAEIFSNFSLEEINEKIANTDINVSKNLNDAVVHECGHAKLIKGKSVSEIETLYSVIKNKGVSGISDIALRDGVECIAEVEVLLSNGLEVPDEALKLYNEYIGR